MKYITMVSTIIICAYCCYMAVMAWTGIWEPNRFGSGALWLIAGISYFIMNKDDIMRKSHDDTTKSKIYGKSTRLIGIDDYAWICEQCKDTHVFLEEGPQENNYNYCCCCGKMIVDYLHK